MTASKDKKHLLEALRENHIVLAACRKTGIGKSSYYRWRTNDPKFAKAADEAIHEGIELVNDAAEGTIVNAIKNQDAGSARFWLTHRHQAYAPKLEVSGVMHHSRELSAEEKEQRRQALKKSSFINSNSNYEPDSK